jgi:6,7-dimethyl-8-ribityllumazine synthase
MKRTEVLGPLDGRGLDIGLAVSGWNSFITEPLLEGALQTCEEAGVESTIVVRVGGALELPVASLHLTEHTDAVVAIGAVIEGETDHYQHVCRETYAGLGRVATDTGVPVAIGVLTVRDVEHARARAVPGPENKGHEAAHAAITAATAIHRLRAGADD